MAVGRCLAESPKVYKQTKVLPLNLRQCGKVKKYVWLLNTSVSIFLCSENLIFPLRPPLSIVLHESKSKKSSLTYTGFAGTR
jgi:hypothetical protein